MLYILSFILTNFFNIKKEINITKPNNYIIYDNDVSEKREKLYEVDFDKKSIIYRIDGRFEGKISKEYVNDILEIIKNTINNQNNLEEISNDEKTMYYKNNVYDFYSIKTYNNSIYYIKNIEQTKEFIELLKHTEKNKGDMTFISLFGILFFACIYGACIIGIIAAKKENLDINGTIVDFKGYMPSVKYKYNDVEYTSESSIGHAGLKIGDVVQISINPNNPEDMILTIDKKIRIKSLVIEMIVLTVIALIIIII